MAIKVKSIRSVGKADVFNLHVEDTHSFLANGLVVHNCYDAGRYFMMARPAPLRDIELPKVLTFDPYSNNRRRA